MSEHEVVYVQMDIVTLYTIINGQKTLEKTSSCNSEHKSNIWDVTNTNFLEILLFLQQGTCTEHLECY